MENTTGYRARYLVLDRDLLKCPDLTSTEKLVLAYVDQIEQYEAPGDSCEEFLDLSPNAVRRAKKHLVELGLLKEAK